jgi:chemosensory pili system protein ChpA (sensor histidine kinase/response regulator)
MINTTIDATSLQFLKEPSLWRKETVRILYVDDHSTSREIMVYILEASGCEIELANDGLEGVEKARSWLPDVILMDLRMPRMDGFEAIARIRSQPETAHIPIIVTSAWANAKHKKRSKSAGANQHFSKPINFRHLIDAINHHLK